MESGGLEPTRDTLAHTLDVLDAQGIPGVLIACLLPEGASLIRAGGVCTDLHGACLGLHIAITAIRDLALSEHRDALAATLQTAADAILTAIQTTTPPREH
jgi:hypothetical protein